MAKRWRAAHFITNELDTMFLFCEALRIGVDDDLRAWAAANPVKSYWDDLCEKFPAAKKLKPGRYYGCPQTLYHGEENPSCPKSGGCNTCWDAPLGTWGEKVVLDERTPPDNGDAACMSCRYEECDVYQEPCLKCVHGEGKTENYRASAAEMERRRKNGR